MHFTKDKLTGYPSIDKPWLKYYTDDAITSKPFDGSIYEHIKKKNENYASNYALQYFGKKFTYKELFENTDLVADSLVSEGVKKGDNVILLMSSCPELVYLLLALNKIGAVANMINPLFTKEQIRDRINDTDAKLMIVLDQLYMLTADISDQLCIEKTIVVPIVNSMPATVKFVASLKLNKKITYSDNVISWKTFCKNRSDKIINSANESELPAIMVYSSGTTGASKGIVLVNKGMNATIAHYEYTGFEYKREQTYLQIIPTWFSTGAVFCLFMPLCLGLCVILEPVYCEENFSKDILKYKPNMIMGATSLWLHFLNQMKNKRADLSFIIYPITGGEKILPKTEIELNGILKECGCEYHLVTGYGMCELGATATSTSTNHYKYGSAGYPIKGVTVAAFDIDTNKECKCNERGEIRVLTPARMKEYYKRPDATAAFFWKDEEGKEWGCTGDIGYVDEDGFAWVEGRASDFFIASSGEKIFCFDIENVILEDVSVAQCEVLGIEVGGCNVPYAFIVAKSADLDINSIWDRCRKNLNAESVPVEIKMLDKFPVNGSGKRDMEQLRQMAENGIDTIDEFDND